MSAKLDPQREITFADPPPPPLPDTLPESQRKRLFTLTKLLEKLFWGGGAFATDDNFRKAYKLARSLCDELAELPGMPENPGKARGDLEEIVAYCLENKFPRSDGEWFYLKMNGNGWKINGHAMKCWRSALRAWAHQGYLPSQRLAAARNGNGQRPVTERELEREIGGAYE